MQHLWHTAKLAQVKPIQWKASTIITVTLKGELFQEQLRKFLNILKIVLIKMYLLLRKKIKFCFKHMKTKKLDNFHGSSFLSPDLQ